MKKRMIFLLLALVLLLSIVSRIPFSNLVSASPLIIRVPQDFSTIQEAINAANRGDIVYVRNGTYFEHVIVDKSDLMLVGEDRDVTVIVGSGGDAVSLRAENAEIRGFTLREGDSGIQISPWTRGHIISDNIITNNDFGIRGHYDVQNITIGNNIIASNKFAGIELVFYNSIISNNTISNNGKGEFIELSAGIQIVEGVYNTTINSNNNMVVNNSIENNFNGVFSVRYSEDNLFSHNTFENNTNHVFISNSSYMSNSRVEENHWSGYLGEDVDGDGFGDTPYLMDAQNRDNHPLMSPFAYWINPIVGDVNRNMRVDIRDVAIAAKTFGAYLGHPRWSPNADINNDDKVDIRDLALIAKNFGKEHVQ